MITRKQALALAAFVLVGAFIIWLGRDDSAKPVDPNLATPPATTAKHVGTAGAAIGTGTPPKSSETK
jgi:hypothetical protein